MVETEIGLRTCRKIKIKRNKIVGGKGKGEGWGGFGNFCMGFLSVCVLDYLE